MSRSRLPIRRKLDTVETGIFMDFVVPFNSELIQVAIEITGAVTTSENLTLIKRSVTADPDFDFLLNSIDLSEGPILDIVCNDISQFLKGDRIEMSYPNTDGILIGAEAVIKEGD